MYNNKRIYTIANIFYKISLCLIKFITFDISGSDCKSEQELCILSTVSTTSHIHTQLTHPKIIEKPPGDTYILLIHSLNSQS